MALITRRAFIGSFVLSAIGYWSGGRTVVAANSPGSATHGKELAIRWRVPREHVEAVRERLRFEGKIDPDLASTEDSRGLPLVYVFVGAVVLTHLADAILSLHRDLAYGAMVIEAQGDETVITNDPRFHGGTIVVRTADGVQIFERDRVDAAELIGALSRLK